MVFVFVFFFVSGKARVFALRLERATQRDHQVGVQTRVQARDFRVDRNRRRRAGDARARLVVPVLDERQVEAHRAASRGDARGGGGSGRGGFVGTAHADLEPRPPGVDARHLRARRGFVSLSAARVFRAFFARAPLRREIKRIRLQRETFPLREARVAARVRLAHAHGARADGDARRDGARQSRQSRRRRRDRSRRSRRRRRRRAGLAVAVTVVAARAVRPRSVAGSIPRRDLHARHVERRLRHGDAPVAQDVPQGHVQSPVAERRAFVQSLFVLLGVVQSLVGRSLVRFPRRVTRVVARHDVRLETDEHSRRLHPGLERDASKRDASDARRGPGVVRHRDVRRGQLQKVQEPLHELPRREPGLEPETRKPSSSLVGSLFAEKRFGVVSGFGFGFRRRRRRRFFRQSRVSSRLVTRRLGSSPHRHEHARHEHGHVQARARSPSGVSASRRVGGPGIEPAARRRPRRARTSARRASAFRKRQPRTRAPQRRQLRLPRLGAVSSMVRVVRIVSRLGGVGLVVGRCAIIAFR